MPLTQLAPPYPIFTDKNGDPLDAGFLYFGQPNLNPETNPIQVYFDAALTQPAAQPLRTSNGYVMRNGSPALIYANEQFSVTVRDKNGSLIIYSPVGYGINPGVPVTFATSDRVVRDVETLLNDQQFTYASGIPNTIQVFPGDIIKTLVEGLSFEVAESAAANQNIETSGGVKLYDLRSLVDAPLVRQKKLMEPFFGFDDGSTNTQIYPNARNALQGIAYCVVNGVEKLFVTQRPIGPAWADIERCRIVEFDLLSDGSVGSAVAISQELNIGHGFDLSALVSGSSVTLYSSEVTALGSGGTAAGKGYSKILWQGASTSQSNVTSYKLWGASGSGHPYEAFNRAGVSVSTDGKWLLMVSAAIFGQKRTVFLYDLASVEALTDPLDAIPVRKFVVDFVSAEGSFSLQGLTMDDNEVIYLLYGRSAVFGHHHLLCYDIDGNLLREFQVDDARSQYGLNGLLDPAIGHPGRFEPEGLTIRNREILLSVQESWRDGAKIVSFDGQNWVAASINSSTIGIPPSNGEFWTRTTQAATDGAWDASVEYGNGTNFSLEKKTIYSVRLKSEEAGEETLSGGIVDGRTEAKVDSDESAANVSFRWRNSFNIVAFSERLQKYINALVYDTSSRWRIYDQREGSDNSVFASAQGQFTSLMRALILRGKGTSSADGAFLRVHANDDPTYPHEIIEGTKPSGNFSRRTDVNGTTRLFADAGHEPLRLVRPDDGLILRFDKVDGTLLWGIWRGDDDPEGSITAPRGSLFIRSTGSGGGLYVKDSGAGNTGWVAK
jgi:hypothetical protein